MRAFAQKSGPQLLVVTGLILIGVVLGFLVGRGTAAPTGSDLAGQAPQAPTSSGAPTAVSVPTARPTSRPTPSPTPTAAAPSPTTGVSDRPDAAAVVAIWDSLERLRELRAYRFTLGLTGLNPLRLDEAAGASIGVRGSLVQRPSFAIDGVFATQLIEFGGAAGVSGSQRFVIIGDTYWEPRPGESPKPRPVGTALDDVRTLLPESMATHVIIPFAAGFEAVGSEPRRGIDAAHYRLTDRGAHNYSTVTACDGTWTGDLWIADNGGYLLAAELRCAVPDASGSDPRPGVLVQIEVTDPDDPTIKVEPPQ